MQTDTAHQPIHALGTKVHPPPLLPPTPGHASYKPGSFSLRCAGKAGSAPPEAQSAGASRSLRGKPGDCGAFWESRLALGFVSRPAAVFGFPRSVEVPQFPACGRWSGAPLLPISGFGLRGCPPDTSPRRRQHVWSARCAHQHRVGLREAGPGGGPGWHWDVPAAAVHVAEPGAPGPADRLQPGFGLRGGGGGGGRGRRAGLGWCRVQRGPGRWGRLGPCVLLSAAGGSGGPPGTRLRNATPALPRGERCGCVGVRTVPCGIVIMLTGVFSPLGSLWRCLPLNTPYPPAPFLELEHLRHSLMKCSSL